MKTARLAALILLALIALSGDGAKRIDARDEESTWALAAR